MFHARTNDTRPNFSKPSLTFPLFNPNRAASHGTCTAEDACQDYHSTELQPCRRFESFSGVLFSDFTFRVDPPRILKCTSFLFAGAIGTTTVKQPETAAKENTQSHAPISPPLVLCLLCTAKQTRSPGSNETSLLTLCSVTRDSRSFTDMLMVTTAVRL